MTDNSSRTPSPSLLRPFWDLSTAHISETTARWLGEGNASQSGEYGYLVHVPAEIEAGKYPGDLETLLQAALGVADYILFDCDGMTDDRFQTFDW